MMREFNKRTLLAKKLAKLAGNKIKKIRNYDVKVVVKGLNDVLTIADTLSEKIITEAILKAFPNDGIIAEEGTDIVSKSGYTWCIDPLDGTMNYSRGIPLYAVSIGYLKDGKPQGGAIYIPEFDELYVTERGLGAFKNGKQIYVSKVDNITNALCAINFNNRYAEMRSLDNKIYKNLMENTLSAVRLYSATIQFCYVASGKYDMYLDIYFFAWDLCVGSLLVEEAGGKVSQHNGTEPNYMQKDKHLVVCSNGKIHNDILKLLK